MGHRCMKFQKPPRVYSLISYCRSDRRQLSMHGLPTEPAIIEFSYCPFCILILKLKEVIMVFLHLHIAHVTVRSVCGLGGVQWISVQAEQHYGGDVAKFLGEEPEGWGRNLRGPTTKKPSGRVGLRKSRKADLAIIGDKGNGRRR